eukprot:Filipodium_phascolosomae@DN2947_c0_g1_i1.p1
MFVKLVLFLICLIGVVKGDNADEFRALNTLETGAGGPLEGCANLTHYLNAAMLFSPGPNDPSHMLEGARVRVWCNNGFRLTGEDEIICLRNKWRFSGHFPTCRAIDCGQPPALLTGHGVIRVDENRTDEFGGMSLGTKAYYHCEAGFELRYKESFESTCLSSAQWSISTPDKKPPECIPMYSA